MGELLGGGVDREGRLAAGRYVAGLFLDDGYALLARTSFRAAPTPAVLQDPLRRVVAAGAHHAAARVRPGAAQVEAVDRRGVLGEQGRGPHEGHLVEPLLALEDRAAREAEDALQVRRREHLVVESASRKPGACSDTMSKQRSAYASRAPSGQPSSECGPYWVNIVTTYVPSSVSDGSTALGTSSSMYGARRARRAPRPATRARASRSRGRSRRLCGAAPLVGEARRLGQDAVDLHRAAAGPEAAHVLADLVREVLARRRARARWCADARRRRRAAPAPPRRSRASRRWCGRRALDRAHRRARTDRRAVRLGAARERLADRAHPALTCPHAPGMPFTRRARGGGGCRRCRRARPGPDADDAGGRDRALERVGLEPVVEQVAHGHRHHAEQLVHVAAASPAAGRPRAAGRAGRRAASTRARAAGGAAAGAGTRGRASTASYPGTPRRPSGVALELGLGAPCRRRRRSAAVGPEGGVARVERHGLVAEVVQPEVGDDLRLEHRDDYDARDTRCPATAPR